MGTSGEILAFVIGICTLVGIVLGIPGYIDRQITKKLIFYYNKLEVQETFVKAIHHQETVESIRDEMRYQRRLLLLLARKMGVEVPEAEDDVG